MAAVIVGALIGAVAVVLGVFLAQSLQEFARTRTRAVSLAREVTTVGSALVNRLDSAGALVPAGWGDDYYRLGSAILELADCCEQLLRSWWCPFSHDRYRRAVASIDLLDARWAAAHASVTLDGRSLSEVEINALILTFGGVARVLRKSIPANFSGYIKKLSGRIEYFRTNGIDADPVTVDLPSDGIPPLPDELPDSAKAPKRKRWMRVLVAVFVLVVVVGRVLGGLALTSHEESAKSSVSMALLKSGVYVDDSSVAPHYFIILKSTSGGALRGSVNYVYEDGQTDVAFAFTGAVEGHVATLIPRYSGSRSGIPLGPSAVSLIHVGTGIQLGECPSYLRFAMTMAACQFALSPSGTP